MIPSQNGTGNIEIQLTGVQKTNLGPIANGELTLFPHGIVGGKRAITQAIESEGICNGD